MKEKNLTDQNFLLYCAQHYQNPSCVSDIEFLEDIRRIKYIKKLLSKYKTSNEINIRLILTHLTVLGNVFGRDVLCQIIWLKFKNDLSEMKPFLIALNLLTTRVFFVNGVNYDTDEISMNENIIRLLRQIKK